MMTLSGIGRVGFLLLAAWTALLLTACRSTPSKPSLPPETPPSEPAPPVNIPAPAPEEPKIPTPTPKISRALPESLIAAPEKEVAPAQVAYNTVLNTRAVPGNHTAPWRYRMTRQGGKLVGFEFSNTGGNRILPPRRNALKNQFFTRDFQFRFDERARQDIHLLISDWPPSRDGVFRLSELMNRIMLFFPRAYLPAIVHAENRNIVTLPTGEKVEFDAATHEIVAGVLSEAPVDLGLDPAARLSPAVEYRGRGVVVQADARGKDPRMASLAVIATGTPQPPCPAGAGCNRCEVKPQELWEQSGAARFKFATDAAFDRFLQTRCGFGLPKIGLDLAIDSSDSLRR